MPTGSGRWVRNSRAETSATPFPNLVMISYFRKTCLSISSLMATGEDGESAARLLGALYTVRSDLTGSVPSLPNSNSQRLLWWYRDYLYTVLRVRNERLSNLRSRSSVARSWQQRRRAFGSCSKRGHGRWCVARTYRSILWPCCLYVVRCAARIQSRGGALGVSFSPGPGAGRCAWIESVGASVVAGTKMPRDDCLKGIIAPSSAATWALLCWTTTEELPRRSAMRS